MTDGFFEKPIAFSPNPPINKISSSNLQTNTTSKTITIEPDPPEGWLYISRDTKGHSVKIALYKVPNKLQQKMIKWFFGWTVELIEKENTKPQKQLLND